MLQRVKTFDLLRADKEELIELATWASLYSATFVEAEFPVPVWLTQRQRDVKRALRQLLTDELHAQLAQAKLQRRKASTVEERRTEADEEIKRLEDKIAGVTN